MQEDPTKELTCRQREWNNHYYTWLSQQQQILAGAIGLTESVFEGIEAAVKASDIEGVRTLLAIGKQPVINSLKSQVKQTEHHHRYIVTAVENFSTMTEMLRDYSQKNHDADLAQLASEQLAGINDFTLAGITLATQNAE